MQLVILTAGRTGEVLGATWNEVDLDTALWAIPAHRMKAWKDHVVPLTDAAVKLLVELLEHRTSEFVFPGQKVERPLSNMWSHMINDWMRNFVPADSPEIRP